MWLYLAGTILGGNTSDITLWKVPGTVHTGAHKAAPEEFKRRMLGWFAEHSASANTETHSG